MSREVNLYFTSPYIRSLTIMASRQPILTRYHCKEGILHIFFKGKWQKKWTILAGEKLFVYKNKSKGKKAKSVLDLRTIIALTCPVISDPESAPLPQKIPIHRGFAIRYNEGLGIPSVLTAFAFSFNECNEWVNCLRYNTSVAQQTTPLHGHKNSSFSSDRTSNSSTSAWSSQLSPISPKFSEAGFQNPQTGYNNNGALFNNNQTMMPRHYHLTNRQSGYDEDIIDDNAEYTNYKSNTQPRLTRSSSLYDFYEGSRSQSESITERCNNREDQFLLPPPYNPTY